jgi:hypothetical protein
MIPAYNLNTAMKSPVLQGSWVVRRMKAIRFHLINLPGRVMDHARELSLRLAGNHPCYCFKVLLRARMRIMALGGAPSG